ncbi:MAG: molybdate transport system permease protein [Candidatus Kentron sp. G]|nr:MAG: molybdate transport system permease protein [Candidatus Kentron sp. G]VFN04640.1 MAG: molybdate transport system permease protein [Candidatus Kentron sp. G]VFN06858.1 MAG: molybdate transport system permease protein [Candidatus Kentron sp. G]
MNPDLLALWITLRLAFVSTIILLLLGIPLAWWLARAQSRLKTVVETVVALPLVLPPTVLGFYLLILLAPAGIIGGLWQSLGISGGLAFTFAGLVIGSVVYSLPFVVQPLQNAFTAIGPAPLEAAATLRAGPLDRFFSIVLPMAKPGLVTAATLGFAHTVGEFGVVLMIGGNIPGQTQVLSIAIYDHVESLEYTNAHLLSAGIVCFSFLLLFIVYRMNGRQR